MEKNRDFWMTIAARWSFDIDPVSLEREEIAKRNISNLISEGESDLYNDDYVFEDDDNLDF